MNLTKLTPFLIVLFFPQIACAQNIGLNPAKQPGGLMIKNYFNSPGTLLGDLVRNSLVLLFTVGGIGFSIMIVWGAVGWILSGGDKEKIAGARKRITTAIIGLVLLSLTFVIMVIVGQITGISALTTGVFNVPGLLDQK